MGPRDLELTTGVVTLMNSVYEFLRMLGMLGLIGKIFCFKMSNKYQNIVFGYLWCIYICKLYYNNNIKAGGINRIIVVQNSYSLHEVVEYCQRRHSYIKSLICFEVACVWCKIKHLFPQYQLLKRPSFLHCIFLSRDMLIGPIYVWFYFRFSCFISGSVVLSDFFF